MGTSSHQETGLRGRPDPVFGATPFLVNAQRHVARLIAERTPAALILPPVDAVLPAQDRQDSQVDSLDGWLALADLVGSAKNRTLEQRIVDTVDRVGRPQASSVVASGDEQRATRVTGRRILLYTDDPQHGGVAQYNHTMLMALISAGHQVSCVQSASDSPMSREQSAAGIKHFWLDYDTGREFGRTLEDTGHAERVFAAEQPDLVIFSDCSPVSNMAARQVAITRGIPYVVVVGFVGVYLAKTFAGQVERLARQYSQAHAVIAVSEDNLTLLRQHFGLSPSQGSVIHYGRPDRFFAEPYGAVRARLRGEQNIPADALVCFTAARLTPIKGFVYQLNAARNLLGQGVGRDVHFAWAGDGEQRAEIERGIAERGLQARVHLLGQRWDVADWYDAADVFVLPSHLEGMPLAIMEAMAKGLPVIATAVSGIPEELGDTGKLLPDPARDAAAVVRGLVETIKLWSESEELRLSEGRRCKERAQQMFREALMVERTLRVVDQGLRSGRKPTSAVDSRLAEARRLFEKGDHVQALRLAATVVASDQRSYEALAIIGEVVLRQNAQVAEGIFKQALNIRPTDPNIAAGLGEALLAQGKGGEAGPVLQSALLRDPHNLRVLLALAGWHEREDRSSEAIELLRRVGTVAPTRADVHLRLGHLLKHSGRLTDALSEHRKACGASAPLLAVDPRRRPVRVAFLVQYPQGWTSIRSAWQAFREDPQFVVTVIASPNQTPNQVEGGSEAIYGFLAGKGVPFVRWTEAHLGPNFADVLFVQLPYDITRPAPLQTAPLLRLVPRLAYVPYALEIGGGSENIDLLTNLPLHQLAWAIFARSERHKAAFAKFCASGGAHVVVTGHPKMDALRDLDAQRDGELEAFVAGRRMVVWNPHYDARPDGSDWGTGYSTFLRWWKFLPAEFARRPDMAFVIRPHPLFFDTLAKRGLLLSEQIEEFLGRCQAAGNIHIDRRSSYLPAFASSAAMLSDASSFVLEYAATGRPLLYLHNPHGPGLNADGAFVRDYCATAQDEIAIVRFLDSVATGDDAGGEDRRAAYRREFMHMPEDGAGVAIKNAVLARLKEEAAQLPVEATD